MTIKVGRDKLGFIHWKCDRCDETYTSPIPILGKTHLCPCKERRNLWMTPEEIEDKDPTTNMDTTASGANVTEPKTNRSLQ